MPALNFKPEFITPILEKTKVTTIRAPRKDGKVFKKDEIIKLYTGMRTKKCRCFAEATVKNVSQINIKENCIIINNFILKNEHLERYAKQDGFENFSKMKEFFRKTHKMPFTGTIYTFQLIM